MKSIHAIFETLDGAKKDMVIPFPAKWYIDFAIMPPIRAMEFSSELPVDFQECRKRRYELINIAHLTDFIMATYREVY